MSWAQTIDPADGWIYDRPSVMLVDEHTQSQAEATGLWLEAAAGTRFVGSQTAGTNGNITAITLPGDLSAYMTGVDTRHADGRPRQRVGLVPDVEVRPTIRGLRAGRDEVLERAVEVLSRR